MDYRRLLKKYMSHIQNEEGIMYLGYMIRPSNPIFDTEDRAVLIALETEILGGSSNKQEPNGVKIDDRCTCSMCQAATRK